VKHMSRRQRRDLEALGRSLAAQDPDLAAQLSVPRVLRREVWASRLGAVMLVAGVVLLACGFLFAATGLGSVGAILLLTFWMPPRIVAPGPG
jgi:hypothetical protein